MLETRRKVLFITLSVMFTPPTLQCFSVAKAVFTQAVSAGVFAERYDLDKINPAEIAAAKDRKNPIEIVTLSIKTLYFSRKVDVVLIPSSHSG